MLMPLTLPLFHSGSTCCSIKMWVLAFLGLAAFVHLSGAADLKLPSKCEPLLSLKSQLSEKFFATLLAVSGTAASHVSHVFPYGRG